MGAPDPAGVGELVVELESAGKAAARVVSAPREVIAYLRNTIVLAASRAVDAA